MGDEDGAGRRPPAPGPLVVVQAFVNSRDLAAGTDELATAAGLPDWLARHGLLGDGEPATGADLRRAVELREALRVLLLANNGGLAEPAALALVNRALRDAEPLVRFLPGGQVEMGALAPGVTGALGHLLCIAFTAMTDGTWARLKACREDGCRRAFYDQSRNRSGTWCAMATCGSRAKMRAYYRRRHPGAP
ncbi:MAG TPA: ABATE domain-containing protein [Actinomycetota bacterium]|nr:ABATE domain-containing protein [Actinomycetota bacterium]